MVRASKSKTVRPDRKRGENPKHLAPDVKRLERREKREDRLTRTVSGTSLFSGDMFSSLATLLHSRLLDSVLQNDYTRMTNVQYLAIPRILEGTDVVAAAPTGSGKTLAFVVPLLQNLITRRVEVGPVGAMEFLRQLRVVIITPTRELAMQILDVLEKVGRPLQEGIKLEGESSPAEFLSVILLIGGTHKSKDLKILKAGGNFLIGTPGRIVDHLHGTAYFSLDKVNCLCLDEADRLLDPNFRKDVIKIVKACKVRKQGLLFSATIHEGIRKLATEVLRKNAVFVNVETQIRGANILQLHVELPLQYRLLFIYGLLKANNKKKMMLFFSTRCAVEFYSRLFRTLSFGDDMNLFAIWGEMKQNARTSNFQGFQDTVSGVLFATNIACRGWDMPEVDIVFQLDPPTDIDDYIHRIGRTGRAGRQNGKAYLTLQKHESAYLSELRELGVQIDNEAVSLPPDRDLVLSKFCDVVTSNKELNTLAKQAYRSYAHAYNAYPDEMKTIFDLRKIDLKAMANAFGLSDAKPLGNINVGTPHKARPSRR